MSACKVVFYADSNGCPMQEFLDSLDDKEEARDRCIARLILLADAGHHLRRPAAENLGRGIWELRARVRNVQYRMLYFFHGQGVVVVSHGITKAGAEVPPDEITKAAARKQAFEANPEGHTFSWSQT